GLAFFCTFHSLCRSAAPYQLPSASYRSLHRARPQFHANRAAPACDRSARSWDGAGSRANRYAWVTFTAGPPLQPPRRREELSPFDFRVIVLCLAVPAAPGGGVPPVGNWLPEGDVSHGLLRSGPAAGVRFGPGGFGALRLTTGY